MNDQQRAILEDQLEQFNKVERLLEDDGEPNSYGYTEFYQIRFGRPILDFRRKFADQGVGAKLAEAKVVFEGGEIDVVFKLVHGRLFSIQYHSPQGIFYPPQGYRILQMIVQPVNA